jgi:hypothetical protein
MTAVQATACNIASLGGGNGAQLLRLVRRTHAPSRTGFEHRSKNNHRQIEEKHGNLRCHIKPRVPEVVPSSILSEPRNISLIGGAAAGYCASWVAENEPIADRK